MHMIHMVHIMVQILSRGGKRYGTQHILSRGCKQVELRRVRQQFCKICNFDNQYYSSGIFNELHYLGRKQIGVKKSLKFALALGQLNR